ncbi:MAG TPA: hypothetical protein VFD15_03990 [Clostridia bacterium]|nr:hypothetical protein [Clostridia bacterium]
MSVQFAGLLVDKFNICEQEKKILLLNVRQLSRDERKILFQNIKPHTKDWVNRLKMEIESAGKDERDKWVNITVDSLLAKGGEPDISDELAMEILGRFYVIHELKKQAEKKGIMLKTLASVGGLGFILIIVVFVTSLILIFTTYLK